MAKKKKAVKTKKKKVAVKKKKPVKRKPRALKKSTPELKGPLPETATIISNGYSEGDEGFDKSVADNDEEILGF